MKKDPRWLKSAIAASADLQITLPWQRGSRSKPESLKTPVAKTHAIAAR